MPVDLDGRESHELPRMVALWDAINEVVAASGGSTTNVCVARQEAVVRVHDALRPLAEELLTLRARVAELERDLDACRVDHAEAYKQVRRDALRGVQGAALYYIGVRDDIEMACENAPWPGCECPGCETARERAAQVDLVASYEAELEEDRQAERDRILGARVREVMEANGTNPERFVSEWCRAQAEYETEEAAR